VIPQARTGANALLPVITNVGLEYSRSCSAGRSVTETIFAGRAWAGQFIESVGHTDYPV